MNARESSAKTNDASEIRFVLDNEVIRLHDVDPTRTVLQFLREDLHRTGTKEGCAEGDCGACTVAVADLDCTGTDLNVRAVNSCIQFLPTLDGKELITVESLGGDSGEMHPVQRAMVDLHASQCGFCTPGFVMSLFALYKTVSFPGRVQIDDALAGNLCRCTGYRPIIEAARAMCRTAVPGKRWISQPKGGKATPVRRAERLRSIRRQTHLHVQYNDRRYYAPLDQGELASLLARHPDAILLAGGTDVGLWVTKQLRELATVIYTGNVRELSGIRVTPTHIEIGAAVSLTDAMALIVKHYPGLSELFRRFGSPPIRNAATLGGNIANGSPIGDSMPALMAASATVSLCSDRGTREVRLEDFYTGYRQTALEPGEFIDTVRIPLPGPNAVLDSHKLSKRFDQDISAVCTAYRLELDGRRVGSFRMACGGLADTVKRARRCEAQIEGQRWNHATIERAAAALEADFTPISDMRASAAYRLRGAQNLLRRFHLETTGAAEQTVYSYGRQN